MCNAAGFKFASLLMIAYIRITDGTHFILNTHYNICLKKIITRPKAMGRLASYIHILGVLTGVQLNDRFG